MSRPIAGVNKYPYGVCGFTVDGAVLRNGTKLKNLRIYKQRSDVMYDLIDPSTDIVYQKMLITGYSTSGYILEYTHTNDQILSEIAPNSFFVRGYNDSMTRQGFIVKFLYNKVVLSSSRPIYDVYTPECHLPLPSIDDIVVDPVRANDTVITGHVLASNLDSTGMTVEVTIDGVVYSSPVAPDGSFSIGPLPALVAGTVVDIVVKSDLYDTFESTVTVLNDDEDTDYVTSYVLNPVIQPGGKYTDSILASVHKRGADLVLQVHKDGKVVIADLTVNAGDVSISTDEPGPYELVMIGKTEDTTPFAKSISLVASTELTILKSEHDKEHPSFTVYDGFEVIGLDVQIDAEDNITLMSNVDVPNARIVITGK